MDATTSDVSSAPVSPVSPVETPAPVELASARRGRGPSRPWKVRTTEQLCDAIEVFSRVDSALGTEAAKLARQLVEELSLRISGLPDDYSPTGRAAVAEVTLADGRVIKVPAKYL